MDKNTIVTQKWNAGRLTVFPFRDWFTRDGGLIPKKNADYSGNWNTEAIGENVFWWERERY